MTEKAEAKVGPVEALWRDFARVTLDPRVGQVQYTEMRRAFYAGVLAFFERVLHKVDASSLSEEEAIRVGEEFLTAAAEDLMAHSETLRRQAEEQLRRDTAEAVRREANRKQPGQRRPWDDLGKLTGN